MEKLNETKQDTKSDTEEYVGHKNESDKEWTYERKVWTYTSQVIQNKYGMEIGWPCYASIKWKDVYFN